MSFATNLALTWLLHDVFRAPEEAAFGTALVAVFLLNFFVMRHYVYRAQSGSAVDQMVRYSGFAVVFRGAEFLGFLLVHTVAGVPYLVAAALVLVASFFIKYVTYGRMVFSTPAIDLRHGPAIGVLTAPPSTLFARGIAVAVFLVAFGRLFYERVPGPTAPIQYDSLHYLGLAYNLANHGTFSLSFGENVTPSAYREPVLPALLAVGIAVHPELRAMSRDRFFARLDQVGDGTIVDPAVRHLLVLQGGILLVVAALAAWIVFAVTRSATAAIIALYLVGLSPGLQSYVGHYQPELLVAFLALGLSALLAVAARQPERRGLFIAAGLTLGVLALTRAVYQYLAVVTVAWFLVMAWRDRSNRRILLSGTVWHAAAIAVCLAPWLARNYAHFGRVYLTERGGVVLNIRAEYNRMTAAEYRAAFLYWTPGPDARSLLERTTARADWARLDRANPDGYYLRGRQRREDLNRELGDRVRADAVLVDEAKAAILRNPLKHLLVSIPIGYRGSFPETAWPLIVNPILFISFAAMLLVAALRRNAALGLFLLPTAFVHAFYTLLSHYIPRYGIPMLPVLWTVAVYVVWRCVIPLVEGQARRQQGH